MLGPVKGSAIQIDPWWTVYETLNIAEGVETSLALWRDGHRPVWATGSAGGIAAFPVIERVTKLTIWADHDASGRSLTDARECAERWTASGRLVVIRYPEKVGSDYADR